MKLESKLFTEILVQNCEKRAATSILGENSLIFSDICNKILLISLDIPATINQAIIISFDQVCGLGEHRPFFGHSNIWLHKTLSWVVLRKDYAEQKRYTKGKF